MKDSYKIVNVTVPEKSYPVMIGSGIRREFPEIYTKSGKGRAFWITDRNVIDAWGKELGEFAQVTPDDIVILPAGEKQKRMTTIEKLCRVFVRRGIERGDTLIAFGGGVVGDITGFAAACYQRGIAFVQIPTTLLAMVDSSVGGKTGVDLPEGKNLVGAFHQPLFVLADIDFLNALPEREFRSGYAELIKSAIIGDASLYEKLRNGAQRRVFAKDKDTLIEVIEACVKFKAAVVVQDEKEGGLRRILNFGHTIGHALETLGNYHYLRHGEAVLWGMAAALDLSAQQGYLQQSSADEINHLLEPLLQAIPALEFTPDEVYEKIMHDKKVKSGNPHFVLLKEIGEPVITDQVDRKSIDNVLNKLHDRMRLY